MLGCFGEQKYKWNVLIHLCYSPAAMGQYYGDDGINNKISHDRSEEKLPDTKIPKEMRKSFTHKIKRYSSTFKQCYTKIYICNMSIIYVTIRNK